jgi:NAD-dependent DNA ligase
MDTREEIKKLVGILSNASKRYYSEAADSPLEDSEYDALQERLRQLDPSNPELTRVGAKPAQTRTWPERQHNVPMLSLEKVKGEDAIKGWYASTAEAIKDNS